MTKIKSVTPSKSGQAQGSSKGQKKKAILIVGDWVVDEYWLLVEHQSEKSSHTGSSHYRILSKAGDITAGLGAAGQTARVLYEIQREENKNKLGYAICGLGSWYKEDIDIIQHLFHPSNSCQPVAPMFQLTSKKCTETADLENIRLETLDKEGSTIRIIRQYHQHGKELVQLSRVDWEPQQDGDDKKATNKCEEMSKFIGEFKNSYDIHDVVIYDSGKGVVDDNLVNYMVTLFKKSGMEVGWYVLSKADKPTWMINLTGKLELVIIRPELAATLKPWDSWLIDGRMSDGARIVIEAYGDYRAKHVILLSEQREVVACMNDTNGTKHCITAKSSITPDSLNQLGWSSAFMAAMVLHMIAARETDNNGRILGIEEQIKEAINRADKYSYSPTSKSPGKSPVSEKPPSSWYHEWGTEIKEWKAAKMECGVIGQGGGEPRLDVWRGATELPGYIAIVQQKRDALVSIGQHLRSFKKQLSSGRSLSIMLQGDPGSGKTFLAKSLASAFGFSFIRRNITQMLRREELLDLFETVATTQTYGGNAPLVFVDEINATLENENVYSAFLSPLEEGNYARHGKAFTLKPCVWIFAGTPTTDKQRKDASKISDFESRMTLIHCLDYKTLHEYETVSYLDKHTLEEEAKVEQVYIGAIAIHDYFPDVTKVSMDTLEKFRRYDPKKSPARFIRKFVASLKNVQYGEIKRVNWNESRSKIKDSKGEIIEDPPEDRTMVSLYFSPKE